MGRFAAKAIFAPYPADTALPGPAVGWAPEVVMEAAILEAIDAIRPALQMDGGDIDYVGIEDGVVKVKLSGACDSCSISWLTLKAGVERILKDRVPGVTSVEAV
jgi:Fe-S cluster biogenesis protein NfuA